MGSFAKESKLNDDSICYKKINNQRIEAVNLYDNKSQNIVSKETAMMIMRVTDMAEKLPSFFTVNIIAGTKKHISKNKKIIKLNPPITVFLHCT